MSKSDKYIERVFGSKPIKILIVENEQGVVDPIARVLQRILDDRGRVYVAYDVTGGRQKAKEHPDLDLIILDPGLPLKTGDPDGVHHTCVFAEELMMSHPQALRAVWSYFLEEVLYGRFCPFRISSKSFRINHPEDVLAFIEEVLTLLTKRGSSLGGYSPPSNIPPA